MRDFRFAEPVWIIGYQTDVFDANNAQPRENYLCHTFFGDQRVTQHDDREMLAIYSDAFTPKVNEWQGRRTIEIEVNDFQPGMVAKLG